MEEHNGKRATGSVVPDLAFLTYISSLANVSLERLISRSLLSANPTSRYHAALQELTWLTEKAIEEALLKRSGLLTKLKSEPEVEVVYCRLPLPSSLEPDIPHIEWNIEENLVDVSTPISFSESKNNGEGDKERGESVTTRRVLNDTLNIRCCVNGINRDACTQISAVLLSQEIQTESVEIDLADTLIIRHVVQFFLDAFYSRVGSLLDAYSAALLEKDCVKIVGSAISTAVEAYKTLSNDSDKRDNILLQLMLYEAGAKVLYYPKFDSKLRMAPPDPFECANIQDLAQRLSDIQKVVEAMKIEDPTCVKFLGSQGEMEDYLSRKTCLTKDVSMLGPIKSWNKFCRKFLTSPLNRFVNFLPYFGDKAVGQEWVDWFLRWTLSGQEVDVDDILNNTDWRDRIKAAEEAGETLAIFVASISEADCTIAEYWLKIYFQGPAEIILSFQPLGAGFVGRVAKNLVAEFLPHSKDSSFAAANRSGMPYKIMGLLETACGLIYSDSTLACVPLMGKGQLLGALLASLDKKNGRLNETDLLILESISYKIGNMLEEFLDARIREYLAKSWNELSQNKNIGEAYEKWLGDFARCLPVALNLDDTEAPRVLIRRLSGESVYPDDNTKINLGDEFDVVAGTPGMEAKGRDYPKLIPHKNKDRKGHIGLYIPAHPADTRETDGYLAVFRIDGIEDEERIAGIWEIFWEHEQDMTLFFSSCIGITGAISKPPRPLQEISNDEDEELVKQVYSYGLTACKKKESDRTEDDPKVFPLLVGAKEQVLRAGWKALPVFRCKHPELWTELTEIYRRQASSKITDAESNELYLRFRSAFGGIVRDIK